MTDTENGLITMAVLANKIDALTAIVQRNTGKLDAAISWQDQHGWLVKRVGEIDKCVDDLEDDLSKIKVDNARWNGVNSIGVIISGILAGLGIKN